MRRGRRVVDNARRVVVTEYAGDPNGEQLAGALAHHVGRQLSGAAGTIYAHAPGNPVNSFTGYARGGIRVGMAGNPVLMRNQAQMQVQTSTSTEMDPYRRILAARMARGQR